jgi:hypothetical protein
MQWHSPIFLRGMATDSLEFFNSLQCIVNVFLIVRQNAYAMCQLKERYKAQNSLSCKQVLSSLYCHRLSMQVRYSIKVCDLQVHSEHKQMVSSVCLV